MNSRGILRTKYLSGFLLVFLLAGNLIIGQNSENRIRLGFNYGAGKQETFPFNSFDYRYDVEFYKLLFNYELKNNRKWVFELNIEPAYYKATHQLLNKYYVKPDWGDNYLEKREEFTKEKTINEYVLNTGVITRFRLYKYLSIYALASIGPMFSDTDTERMSAGFAFSDIFGLGISYQAGKFFFDLRYSLRHVSNANIRKPNNGYNSANLEFGLSYVIN